MKMTLLRMTQLILSAMDEDEINSIGDSVESLQVANVIQETYYELFSDYDIPSFHGLVELEPASNPDEPTKMFIPGHVKEIEWIKYNWQVNGANDFRDVKYLDPRRFISLGVTRSMQTNGDTIQECGAGYAPLFVLNDRGPTWWTTFDNNALFFDAFNSSIESAMQASNSISFGQKTPPWEMTDMFIPELDDNLFPLLLAEAKSVSFLNFKQASNPKEEQKSRRQQVHNQNDRWRGNQRQYLKQEPNYGRKTAAIRPRVFEAEEL
jgi:hypothetical protein